MGSTGSKNKETKNTKPTNKGNEDPIFDIESILSQYKIEDYMKCLVCIYGHFVQTSLSKKVPLAQIINLEDFLLYLAIYAINQGCKSIKHLNNPIINKVIAELSLPKYEPPEDYIVANYTDVLCIFYENLVFEASIFPSLIGKRHYLNLDNPYELYFSSDIRVYMKNKYLFSGREMFCILSDTIDDSRAVDLEGLFTRMYKYKLNTEPRTETMNSPHSPSL
jgi:hypothetical protein